MKMTVQHTLLGITALTTLAGCGGGGGGSGTSSTPTTASSVSSSYTGNRGLAALSSNNRQDFTDAFELALFDITSNMDLSLRPGSNMPTDANPLPELAVTPLGGQIKATSRALDAYIAQQVYHARAINETYSCEQGGNIRLSGDINDNTGTGRLNASYNQCKEEDITLNGTAVVNINSYNFAQNRATNYSVATNLTATYNG